MDDSLTRSVGLWYTDSTTHSPTHPPTHPPYLEKTEPAEAGGDVPFLFFRVVF